MDAIKKKMTKLAAETITANARADKFDGEREGLGNTVISTEAGDKVLRDIM